VWSQEAGQGSSKALRDKPDQGSKRSRQAGMGMMLLAGSCTQMRQAQEMCNIAPGCRLLLKCKSQQGDPSALAAASAGTRQPFCTQPRTHLLLVTAADGVRVSEGRREKQAAPGALLCHASAEDWWPVPSRSPYPRRLLTTASGFSYVLLREVFSLEPLRCVRPGKPAEEWALF